MTALSSMTKAQLIAELVKVRDGRDATITRLDREKWDLRNQLDELEEILRTGEAGPRITDLENQIKALADDKAELTAKVEDLLNKVESLETELATAETERDEALDSAYNAEVNEHDVAELQAALDAIDRARVDLDYRGYCGSEPHRLAAEVLARALDS